MNIRHLIALCTFSLGAAAYATTIVDQQNIANFGTGFSYIYQNDTGNAQSFVQSANNISGGGFQLGSYWGFGAATFTIGVYSANPYNNPGSLLASATGTGSPGSWVDAFWAPVNVAPNTSLYLSISGSSNSYYASVYTYLNNYTAGGMIYYGSDYSSYGYDFGFRTYADTNYTNGVPDSSSTLFLVGGALLGFATLRRKFART